MLTHAVRASHEGRGHDGGGDAQTWPVRHGRTCAVAATTIRNRIPTGVRSCDTLARMPQLGVKETAAVNRLAAMLAPHLTNGIVDGVAKQFDFKRLPGSSKTKKLQWVIGELLEDRRSRSLAAQAITALTMEAHHRTVAGTASMTTADADAVVAEMRVLGLPVGDLARAGWRAGLRAVAPATPGDGPAAHPSERSRSSASPRPQRHDEGLTYIGQLAADDSRPQHRGRELEKIAFALLLKEKLQPTSNIVNPGEQLDLAFVLDGQHYLAECKWERDPVGLPHVSLFATKVGRKAEGTFGVLVSMSGFVGNICETAARGARLNCIGVGHRELIGVLEGRTTFADVVRAGRALASTKALFYSA